MSTKPAWVRRFHGIPEHATHVVVVFPHAGGGASAYRHLSAAITGAGVEALTVQYPGRQDRAAQPHPGSLAGLAQGGLDELITAVDGRPVTLFGHSMGAIVAFEAARALENAGVAVTHLVPSAAVPPSLVADLPPHPSSDEELLARAALLEGSDPAVLADSTIARMALPAMRADFAAFDAYDCPDELTIAAPVTALGGIDDPAVPAGRLHGWSAHTTASAQVRMLPGGHFFIHDHTSTVARLLTSTEVPA